MMERLCIHASYGPALLTSSATQRCTRSSGSCLGRGITSVVTSTCCFRDEQRWQLAFRKRRRNGLVNIKQIRARAGLEELLHNHVLVSTTVAGLLGQLAKPVTSALGGKGFNWRLSLKSGGMPSTHSATVAAVATAVGLERGLSDSLFGVAVIMATLFMYDAQGVRRAVGKQAEVVNKMVSRHMDDPVLSALTQRGLSAPNPSRCAIGVELARDPVEAELAFMEDGDTSSYNEPKGIAVLRKDNSLGVNGTSNLRIASRLPEEQEKRSGSLDRSKVLFENTTRLSSMSDSKGTVQEVRNLDGWQHVPLKESVGHTKVEVFVGALWGFLITLAVYPGIQ